MIGESYIEISNPGIQGYDHNLLHPKYQIIIFRMSYLIDPVGKEGFELVYMAWIPESLIQSELYRG